MFCKSYAELKVKNQNAKSRVWGQESDATSFSLVCWLKKLVLEKVKIRYQSCRNRLRHFKVARELVGTSKVSWASLLSLHFFRSALFQKSWPQRCLRFLIKFLLSGFGSVDDPFIPAGKFCVPNVKSWTWLQIHHSELSSVSSFSKKCKFSSFFFLVCSLEIHQAHIVALHLGLSVIVITMLAISSLSMVISITMIIMIECGFIFQRPLRTFELTYGGLWVWTNLQSLLCISGIHCSSNLWFSVAKGFLVSILYLIK